MGKDSNMDEERFKNIIPPQAFVMKIKNTNVQINGKIIEEGTFQSILNKCNVKFGFCIRCGDSMKNFSPTMPLCY